MYSRALRISKNIGFYFEFFAFLRRLKKKKNFLNSKTKLTSSHLAVEMSEISRMLFDVVLLSNC